MIVINGLRYAVKIECDDGRTWLAHGKDPLGTSLFESKGAARSYKAELKKHLKGAKLTVVPVVFRLEEIK